MIKIRFVCWACLILVSLLNCSRQRELREVDIPEDLPKFQILYNKENVFDGYIFLRKLENPGAQFMINNKGKIVWYQRSDTTIVREFMPYKNSYLSLYSDKKLHEISYEGDTLITLEFGRGGFDKPLHHEIIKDSKNRIVALTREEMLYDLSRFGGNVTDTLKTDGIIVLSEKGQKLWHWSFDNVLDTINKVDVDIFQVKNDWVHANSLFEDLDGNYLVSFRDLNQVWKLNSQTGEVMWKYGGENDVNEDGRFKGQHVIHRNLDGNYMVFNNSPGKFNFSSRAIEFNLVGDSLRNTHVINLPDSVFTQKEGSVYQIDGDKFLFCVTRTNDLIITNRRGDVLWHAKADIGFYRAYYLDKSVLNK